MTAPARPQCEWFLGCRRRAVAIISHPRKPTPACQACIDRMGLRSRIVAPLDGRPLAAVPVTRHRHDHFFRGVCICACTDCTGHTGPNHDVVCICPDCPPIACGLKAVTA